MPFEQGWKWLAAKVAVPNSTMYGDARRPRLIHVINNRENGR
jgi:hypothetical protein